MRAGALFLVILRGVEITAGWWLLFYRLNTPESRIRRTALLIAIPSLYAFWYLLPLDVWFGEGTAPGAILHSDSANELLWALCLLTLACIKGAKGRLRASIITALWYIGIEQNVDVLRSWMNRLINGGPYIFNYIQFNIEYLIILGWAVFYYRSIARNSVIPPPAVFQFQTLGVSLTAALLLTHYSSAVRSAAGSPLQMRMIRDGLLIGVFLMVINLLMFHFFLRLFLKDAAKTAVIEAAKTPPLWTPGKGLSEAFCKQKRLTPKERAVTEALMEGKATYKEISIATGLTERTVGTYLAHVYQKTGVPNMMALYSLIKG